MKNPNTTDTEMSGTNGINGTQAAEKQGPLTILVAGAGIGGLTAAIALRQQGHIVKMYERSQFAQEVGAAVHIAPNSNGILRRIGIFPETFGSNPMDAMSELDYAGNMLKRMDLSQANKMWQNPWLLAHRVHLHEALKTAAASETGKGRPCELNTARKVTGVDEVAGTLTLEDGEVVQGDVIIGADGVRSVTRTRIAPDIKPFSCEKSAFRFLIPKATILADPQTAPLLGVDGELKFWYDSDRRIVMYPTSDNTVLNFLGIHPAAESNASSDWNTEASLETMLKVFSKFNPDVLAMIGKADPKTLKVWELLDMAEIPVWNKDRLALIGDAGKWLSIHSRTGLLTNNCHSASVSSSSGPGRFSSDGGRGLVSSPFASGYNKGGDRRATLSL